MTQTLSEDDKRLAQATFAKVLPQAHMMGLLFYARLFETDPALRQLFKVDLEDQSHSLVTMLQLCIEGLDERAELQFALRNLGARHVEYGVKPRDYATVEDALMWAMQSSLGEGWNAETEQAIHSVFKLFLSEMQRGAESAPPTAEMGEE